MADGGDIAAGGTTKPVIFISYSHKDEPGRPGPDDIAWLTFVQSFLAPVVKTGIFDLWVDQHLHGGDDLDPEIKAKLASCDIFVLLASRFSLASTYVVETEIATMRKRKADGENVHLFPIVLSPIPNAALKQLKDLMLKPKDGKPLSLMSRNEREVAMAGIADDIAAVAEEIAERKRAAASKAIGVFPWFGATVIERSIGALSATIGFDHIAAAPLVDTAHLPETAYERLVGRDDELTLLDEAWSDDKTNIMSLIAEGGAGKSALVNEWLKRLQADGYRGAEAVLGWSFYSQGSKERATSAEEFINWALAKLGLKLETTSATAKAEAIAEAMMKRRVLLVLDGVEPLQHGLDAQQGQLKDQGLRALLRRVAAAPPGEAHALIVLTSRLPVRDIARWKDSAAPVVDVERLSDEAGAALLRDNGVWGTDKELKRAAQDFGGHPLALALLASFLKETQFGDVRRRDHIRGLLLDEDNPRHDHAKRVMESYEKEWLVGRPESLAIMHMVGLFDRPASGDCLKALRRTPIIEGLTDKIVGLDDAAWQRALARLREVRLLAAVDPSTPDALDAHPLVREWFGERLKTTNEAAWRAAHGRLYEHLRDTTKEGDAPTLEDLAPLYQAIAHGCRAGQFEDVLEEVYVSRVYKRRRDQTLAFYSFKKLGANAANLAALSWFFDVPFRTPHGGMSHLAQTWVLAEAAFALRIEGRLEEALPAQREALRYSDWKNRSTITANIAAEELLLGVVSAAVDASYEAVNYADFSAESRPIVVARAMLGDAVHAAGNRKEARKVFEEAEYRFRRSYPLQSFLPSLQGYLYCDLLINTGQYQDAQHRANSLLQQESNSDSLLQKALLRILLARTSLGLNLISTYSNSRARGSVQLCYDRLLEGLDRLRGAGTIEQVPRGLLARAAFRRSIGDWEGAARDLDEVEEIAEPGPMRLYLCDMALERARLALAKSEAFAPLNGMLEKDNPPKPEVPDAAQIAALKGEAAQQIAIAAEYIATCGYHRRDEERDELQAVLRGERKFADLPPRV